MQCQQCGKELPANSSPNKKFCDECLAWRKKERRRRYYITVERAGSSPAVSEASRGNQIREPEDGYILLAAEILKKFSSEYESVLQRCKDNPCKENEQYLQAYENRLRREFEYYRILTLGQIDDVEAFTRSYHLKMGV